MLDALVPALARMGGAWPRRAATIRVAVIIVVSVASMVVARFIPVEFVQVIIGAAGGLTLFCGLYLLWATALPEQARETLNWRGRFSLPRRRMLVAWAAGAWVVTLLLFGALAGGPVAGGFTTAVVLCLWHAGTASAQEREDLEVQMEQYEQDFLRDQDTDQEDSSPSDADSTADDDSR
jgi:MFS family permease